MITLEQLLAKGPLQDHDSLERCDIVDCRSIATMYVCVGTGELYVLCDKHYLVYLSYLGLVRESKL